jgi:amino acid transporter
MTDNIIATERKTLFFFLWLLYCLSLVFLSVAIILSVICFSFCGYYIMSLVFLSVAIILSVICFSFCGYYIISLVFLIATERKTNNRQYNSHRKKNQWHNIVATERKTNDRQYNSHRKKIKWQTIFLSVAIILSVICFSFCGYYIVCYLFFFLWLLYYVIEPQKEKQMTENIIATERKTNDII